MRIILAPMEGVVDHTMRAMLTRVGGIDRCVTEFIRVTDQCFPPRVFYRYCPELRNGGVTPSGVPVYLQLLGGKPGPMAENAHAAAALGAPGIDINFGCPAKQVNRNDGGSIILREPQRIFDITHAVRQAVPAATPVTVKVRLGYENSALFRDVVDAAVAGGASELAIHARTKLDGYKPPAYWAEIAAVSRTSKIPIIANGEIWSVENYRHCIQQSGCVDVMLGRGILACPDLARQVKAASEKRVVEALEWLEIIELIADFGRVTVDFYNARHVGNRIKQWLAYLRRQYPMAGDLFESVKRLRWPQEIASVIEDHRQRCKGASPICGEAAAL